MNLSKCFSLNANFNRTRWCGFLIQLTNEKKAPFDILFEQGLSMSRTAEVLEIGHSTISRYKVNIYIHIMIIKLVQ